MSDDPYVYPGTNVLKNVPGIRDQAALDMFEQAAVVNRIAEGTPEGDFDLDHLRAIHCQLFQDVYPWAGEIRTVQIAKGDCAFMPPRFIEAGMQDIHNRLKETDGLKGLDRLDFVKEVSVIIGDVNHVHPFREGNGRTQMHYLKQLCGQAGHDIDLRRIKPGLWIDASIAANRADYGVMERSLRKAYHAVDRAEEARRLRLGEARVRRGR